MKKTELKQIIKEEFKKVLNENESYSYNTLLPGYEDLPETRKDAIDKNPDFSKRKVIYLPSLNSYPIKQMEGIDNKEDIKNYVEKYEKKFGVKPEFFEDENYPGQNYYDVKVWYKIPSDTKIDTTGD